MPLLQPNHGEVSLTSAREKGQSTVDQPKPGCRAQSYDLCCSRSLHSPCTVFHKSSWYL